MNRTLSTRTASLILAIATAAIGIGMFFEPHGIASSDEFRNNDWLNCRSFDVLSRRALLTDGEFPLRTHLFGGGFPVIAHPSDGSWAPTILPVLLFGDVIGVKVNILIFLFLGSIGVFLIARDLLRIGASGSLFSALLFALSGWLPSMLLVGFYNQLFFLVAPLALYFLLDHRGQLHRLIAAGALLLLALQQGGHAFPAVVFFCGLCCWLFGGQPQEKRHHPIVLSLMTFMLLLLWTAPAAISRGSGSILPLVAGWTLALAVHFKTSFGRHLSRQLQPWGLRLTILLLVTCSLGCARLVGLTMMAEDGAYEHTLQRRDALWFPDPHGSPVPEERFYEGIADFLHTAADRVPKDMEYGFTWGRQGDPIGHEYAYLGLTTPGLILGLFGLVLMLIDPRRSWMGMVGLIMIGVCFGWRAPPDLHFLLTWGVPTLNAFSQPIKYWNFFVLVALVLGSGTAVEWFLGRSQQGHLKKALALLLFGLLSLPLLQNVQVYKDTFEFTRPQAEPQTYEQVMLVAEEDWAQMSISDIRSASQSLHLRDYVRPNQIAEYANIPRGVGTIDWYGSLVMAQEHAIPKTFVTLEGKRVANPSYRGEVWIEDGSGDDRVTGYEIGHNALRADVSLSQPRRVVFNQNWLEGFESSLGEPSDHSGLVSIELPAGQHQIELNYRPKAILLALALSFVSLVFWGVLFFRSRSQEMTFLASNGDTRVG